MDVELVMLGCREVEAAFVDMNSGTPVNMEGFWMWTMFTGIRSHEAVVHLLATPAV